MGPSDETISVERVMPFAAERIFAVISDPERHPDLDGSGTVRRVRASRLPLSVGSHFDMHMKRGFSYSTRNTVTALERDRAIAWTTRPITFPLSMLIGGRTWSYTLEPVGDGTRVTQTWDVRPEKNGWLVKPLAGDPRADMTSTLERLERLLSSEA